MGLFDRWSGRGVGTGALEAQLEQAKTVLERSYATLGRRYYQSCQGAAPGPEEETLFRAIAAGEQQVKACEQEVLAARGQRRCPHCGEIISNQVLFCSNCGKRVAGENQIPCPHCRKLITKDALFCKYCGHPVNGGARFGTESAPVRFCSACGGKVEEPDAEYCPECGAPVPRARQAKPTAERVCPNCGAAVRPGERRCPSCGLSVGQDGVPEENAQLPHDRREPHDTQRPLQPGRPAERPQPPFRRPDEQEWPEEPGTRLWTPETDEDVAADGQRTCPKCGNTIAPDESFCNQCGSPAPLRRE